MTVKGICISDKDDHHLKVTLFDILEEISNGDQYKWAILFLDGMPKEGKGKQLLELKELIENSHRCLSVNWKELLKVCDLFFQLYEIVFIGCKSERDIKNYKSDKEMFESCDIAAVLIDCSWWEVSSKDSNLIKQYESKFTDTKPLDISQLS